jgi:hypothetical protein
MAVGASKPTVVADKDGFFSVKSKMLVSCPSHMQFFSQYWKLVIVILVCWEVLLCSSIKKAAHKLKRINGLD